MMLRYSASKVKTLKKLNINTTNTRLVGGINVGTINTLNIKYKEFIFIYVFRLTALSIIKKFKQPDWCFFEVPDINYDDISYFSSSINLQTPTEDDKHTLQEINSLLGLDNINSTSNTALGIILDSVSIIDTATTILIKTGIIFMPLFDSLTYYSYLVSKYLGTIVPIEDNFYAALNSSVFSGGSFCYIPKNIKCTINLSTYFRTHSENYAQFERTLLIADENSLIKYNEGCSAPVFVESQLHVALVEILVKKQGIVNYSTVQNWYRGDQTGEGGLYNFTTKRGWCLEGARLDWIQVEMGSAITWKYPSTYLIGTNSSSNFFSLSLISDLQIADTGNKMLHIGSFTKSRVYSKSISLDTSLYTYRGLVEIFKKALNTYNYTECDSLLLGNKSSTATIPYTVVNNYSTYINQEASISKIEADFLFLLLQRGITFKNALTLLIYGFCQNICSKLPLEIEMELPLLILTRTQSNF